MRREKIKNTQGFLVRNPAIDAELQIQMGIQLQRLFAETVRQPVPARVARLLDRLKLADRRDDADVVVGSRKGDLEITRFHGGKAVFSFAVPSGGSILQQLVRADHGGYGVLVVYPGSCSPRRSAGLPNAIRYFDAAGTDTGREDVLSCKGTPREDVWGENDLGKAATAPDGSVLVPRVDADGLYFIRIRPGAP